MARPAGLPDPRLNDKLDDAFGPERPTGPLTLRLEQADLEAVGRVITYARRYCLCAVTGLAPGGDDDGTAGREASRRGETLDEASTLSLPPRESESIVAALEPQALTPLAQYGELWKTVVARRAAGKPSPVMHDGRLLTWSELFGFSLAQRIDALTTTAACRAFYDEARAGGAKSVLLMAQVWQGAPLAGLADEIDAAFMERGELTGDEHGALHEILATRPEPGPDRTALNFLAWQAEVAPNEIALDELAKR